MEQQKRTQISTVVFGSIDRTILTGISLLIFLVILLIYHFWGFFGHYGYDDMSYAGLANTVLNGKFSIGNDHANYRWVVIIGTALSYRLLGINDQASALMPMLFTLATAWLVARSVSDKWQAVMTIFLFGLHSWTLYYADKIMPDIYVAAFFFAAIYIIYRQRVASNKPYMGGVLLAMSLFFAILSKETIILTIPVFGYLLVTDVWQKRNGRFWITTIVCLTVIMCLYLIFIKIETGHFLQRYYAIKSQSYFNPCSFDLLPISETIRRISSGLWLVFVRSGLFLLLVFGLVAVVQRSWSGLLRISNTEDFFPIVFILTLLCCNFMSTSVSHYVPMCEDPRHYLFLIPVAAIAGSKGLLSFLDEPKKYFWVVPAFIIVFYTSLSQSYENPYSTYMPLVVITLMAIIISFIKLNNRWVIGINILLCICLLIVLLAEAEQSMIYARQMGYRFQKALVRKALKGNQNNILVVTNTVERNMGPYLLAYDTSHVIFRSFEDMRGKSVHKDKKIYLLMDGYSYTLTGKTWQDLPLYARDVKQYKLVDKSGGAELYEINEADLNRY